MHVPVSTYKDVWAQLEKGEDWGHLPGQEPWLGVVGAADAKDALISEVKPNSPAARAGLKPGDVVISVNGKYIADFEALKARVTEWKPFHPPWTVQVLRGGEIHELSLRIRPRG
jgi:serine protease Do